MVEPNLHEGRLKEEPGGNRRINANATAAAEDGGRLVGKGSKLTFQGK